MKKKHLKINIIMMMLVFLFLVLLSGCNNNSKIIADNNVITQKRDDIYQEVVIAKSRENDDENNFISKKIKEIKESIKEASVYDIETGINSDAIVTFGEIKKGGEKGKKVNWIVLEKQNGKALLLSQEALFYLNSASNIYKKVQNKLLANEDSEYYKLYVEIKSIDTEAPATSEMLKNKYIRMQNIEDKMNRILLSNVYDAFMKDACFDDDEYDMVLDSVIDTIYYDRDDKMKNETATKKFFSMSKIEAEKYFGLSNPKYENEKLRVETLNPLTSSKKNTKKKEYVDYLLRDGAHYDKYVDSELTVENTYGTKFMYVNNKGYVEQYGKYPIFDNVVWFRPMCIVEYEENESEYKTINKMNIPDREFDAKKLKDDIDDATSVIENKNADIVDDYIKFADRDWLVVKKENGKALLQSRDVLLNKAFTIDEQTWYDSTLRKHLNTEFYDTFTNEEKQIICTTKIALPFDEEYERDIYYKELERNYSMDKVFILSPNEIEEYFSVDLYYGEKNLDRIRPKEYLDNVNMLATRTDDMHYVINSELKMEIKSKKAVVGIRPCIVIKYDNSEKKIDEYSYNDEDVDVLYYVNLVKNDIVNKYGKKVADTVHYVGRPIDYYDEEFVFNESRNYYKRYDNPELSCYFYDELRSLESSVLGRIDLYISPRQRKCEYETLLSDDEILLNISAFEKGIIKDAFANIKIKKDDIVKAKNKNRDFNLLDKVVFGKYENDPLIWTIVDCDDEKLTLLSDYTFDVKFNDKRKGGRDDNNTNVGADILDKCFSGKELESLLYNEEGDRYSILDYKKYNDIFTNKNDRIVLGCVTEENYGSKSYFVGGPGEYKKSVNACDKNGDIYNAKDNFMLPNRVLIEVKSDVPKKIDGKDDVQYIDFYKDGCLYENYKIKSINLFGEENLDHIAAFSNDLVYKGNEVIYVDYDGKEKVIKDFSYIKEGTLRPGDIIYYGICDANNNNSECFSNRMIYRVAEINDNIALLHSVFSMHLDDNIKDFSGFKSSKLKNYLNGEFYNKSFDDKEKIRIINSQFEYIDDAYQKQKLDDKIYILSDEEIKKYYTNLNIQYTDTGEILNTRAIIDEYTYANDDYNDSHYYIYDRQIKNLGFYFYISPTESYPLNYAIDTLNGHKYSNIYTGSVETNEKSVVISFRIKLGEQTDVGNNMVSLPEPLLSKYENKAFTYNNNFYFIDENNNFNVVKNFNDEYEVDRDRIEVLFHEVGSVYRRKDKIYCVANMKYKKTSDDTWGEWMGDLYVIENGDTVKEVYNDVCEVFYNINDEIVKFYTEFSTKGRFVGEITVEGKIYKYADGKVYDEKEKVIKNAENVSDKLNRNNNVNDKSKIIDIYNPLNNTEDYERYIEFFDKYYIGWYDKKTLFDDCFELNKNSIEDDGFDYESFYNELKGQEVAYIGKDILLKENSVYKSICKNIVNYSKLDDNSFAVTYAANLDYKIDFADFLKVDKLSRKPKMSEIKTQIYYELMNYMADNYGSKLQIYNNKFYDVNNSENIKFSSEVGLLKYNSGWYVINYVDEKVYNLTFDGSNYNIKDLNFKMRYLIYVYDDGKMLFAMKNSNNKFDILFYDKEKVNFIKELPFKVFYPVIENDIIVKLKDSDNNFYDIDLSKYQ